jgi:predicted phosphodiesterase
MGVNYMLKANVILVIADQHIPYHHQDMFRFLKAVKKQYNPDLVVNIGDEVDKHAMSFHDSDPNLASAGDELKLARKAIKQMAKIFPEMYLVDSNHGSLANRKAKHHGIPQEYLRGYGEVLQAPEGWVWQDELEVMSHGNQILFRHQWKKNPLICAQQMGACLVQGHFHEDFNIQYASSPNKLLWAMTVGCLIDKKSLAFRYNATNYKRPILGSGVIINGQPILLPMLLNKSGRWVGKVSRIVKELT